MQDYYHLRWLQLCRLLAEQKLPLGLAIIGSAIGFYGLSYLLFWRTDLAVYWYVAISVAALWQLGQRERTAFAHLHLSQRDYRLSRLVENVVVGTSFALYLLYESYWLPAITILILAIVLSPFRFGGAGSRAIPTPFRRHPFEFTAGFRKSWPILLVIAFVALQGFLVQNLALSLAMVAAVSLLGMNFILPTEPPEYVRIYTLTPIRFLWHKIGRAALGNLVLALPLLIAVVVVFPGSVHLALLLQLLGTCVLALTTVMKYTAYPADMDLPCSLLLAASIILFPLLPITFLAFYPKAKRSLSALLT